MDNTFAALFADSSFIVSVVTMIVGIIACYVAALPKRGGQIAGNIALAVVFNLFTYFYYKNALTTAATVIMSFFWVIICLILSKKSDLISRRKLDSMIRKFTENANYSEPLCIFGGDLDFLGCVVKTLAPLQKRAWYKNNSIIQCNKQFKQLKNMKFREIQILSLKPVDSETRIRIGFLKEELGDALTIKFIEEKDCRTCDERSTCLVCDECNNCPHDKACKRNNVNLCSKLEEYNQYRCYNPDTKLRGRIAKIKGTGATSVAIVTTHIPGKTYLLKEYSSNTKECTIYLNIWNVWWAKCKEDEVLVDSCIREYENYTK